MGFLRKELQGRHLEDIIQHVAMEDFIGNTNWKWSACNYCRDNGLNFNSYSKMGARALENSLSIDTPSKNEESENSLYLLDQESILRSKEREEERNKDDSFLGALEEFLSPILFNNEVLRWTLKHYKVKTKLK